MKACILCGNNPAHYGVYVRGGVYPLCLNCRVKATNSYERFDIFESEVLWAVISEAAREYDEKRSNKD